MQSEKYDPQSMAFLAQLFVNPDIDEVASDATVELEKDIFNTAVQKNGYRQGLERTLEIPASIPDGNTDGRARQLCEGQWRLHGRRADH